MTGIDRPTGFTCDGVVIVGYIEVVEERRTPEAEQLRSLGIAVSGSSEPSRVRVALPIETIGPFYEANSAGESLVIVYAGGEAWYLRGAFDAFVRLYRDAISGTLMQ